MSLLTLPPELLANIIRKLDTKSVYNLYEAGIMCMQGLVKECHFSMNTLATSKSLRSNFFAGVSGYLTVLNLSGVPDLDLPSLIVALSDMKNLKDLDVSYTNITITDFLQIAKTRPALKSIAINFSFGKRETQCKILNSFFIDGVFSEINEDVLLAYQQAFEGLKNVHFVGKINANVNGSLAVLVLEKADLFNLKFSSKGYTGSFWQTNEYLRYLKINFSNKMRMPKMLQFQLYYIRADLRSIFAPPIYKVMDFNKYEVLVIGVYYPRFDLSERAMQKVVATPLLKKLICDNFDVNVTSLPDVASLSAIKQSLPALLTCSGVDTVCMFWDRERTKFDSKFSAKLLKIFKEHYMFNVDISTLTLIPAAYEWCNFEPSTPPGSQITALDYGYAFSEKETIKLKISFDRHFKISTIPKIINNFDFLKKITHLSLSGNVNCDSMFFKYLFENCDLLITLQIAFYYIFDDTFLQFVKSSKSLKNIFVLARGTVVSSQLFSYLSECQTLENIYLYQLYGEKVDTLPNLIELFRKCTNLYNLCINTSMRNKDVADRIFGFYRNVAKYLGRDAIHLSFTDIGNTMSYHSYLSVFNHAYQLNPACSKILSII